MRERKARERRAEGSEDDTGEEAAAAEELVERAAIDGNEEQCGQRKRVDEAVQRLARVRIDQAKAPGQHAAGDERKDREGGAENRV